MKIPIGPNTSSISPLPRFVWAILLAIAMVTMSSCVDDASQLVALDSESREAAVRRLGGGKDPQALEQLLSATKDPDAKLRYFAVLALWRREDKRAIGPLIAATGDDCPRVRCAALLALETFNGPRVAALMAAALKDDNAAVRYYAVEALGRMSGPNVTESLISVLRTSDRALQAKAVKALGRQKSPHVADAMIEALGLGHSLPYDAIKSAEDTLVAMEGDQVVAKLIAGLKYARGPRRGRIAKILGRRGEKRAIGPLIAALKDKNLYDTRNVVETLAKFKATEAIPALLEKLRTADNDSKASWYAEALWAICGRATDEMLDVLDNGSDSGRIGMAQVLGGRGERSAVKRLIPLLHAKRWRTRSVAARALGDIGDPRATKALIAALQDPHERAWLSPIYALGRIGGREAIAALIAVSEDPRHNAGTTGHMRYALMDCTDKDFGKDFEKWRQWWEKENADGATNR